MLPIYEIVIKPKESALYFRLLLVLYALTCGLMIDSSLPALIQFFLILAMICSLRAIWRDKRPNNKMDEIQFSANNWILLNGNKKNTYKELNILIHNTLFQLIQFSDGSKKKKLVVLFQDQLSSDQWRLLSLKAINLYVT